MYASMLGVDVEIPPFGYLRSNFGRKTPLGG